MAIQNDFIINPDTKVIRHIPTKSTVYSAVAFYSYLQDTFDEPGFLSYQIPIRFNTPTSFTMVNGWFLDDGDGSNILQFLTGGGIDTLGYATIADPVLMIDLDYGTLSFEIDDKDKTVTHDGTDIGPLLSYKDNYPTASTARIWVRDTNTGSETTVPGEIIDVTGGNGNYTTTGYSASGDNIYHNLFTIAAFPVSAADANPQVYIYQNHPVSGDRVRIPEWSHLTNWGDGNVAGQSRGSIDVLITIQLAGSLIDGGSISTFVRQTGDSFTFVESTLTTSGRTPIATETSSDEVNITKGENYLLYDSRNYAFNVGEVITNVSIGGIDADLVPPSWYAEIFAVDEFADTTTGLLTLKALNGTISDGDSIYVGELLSATANGKVGDTLAIYDTVSTVPDVNDIDTVLTGTTGTPKRLLSGFDTAEKYLIMRDDPTGVTGPARNFYYVDFAASEQITGTAGLDVTTSANPAGGTSTTSQTLIAGYNDITVANINGTVTASSIGTLTPGERVTWSGGEAIYITDNGTNEVTLGNVQNPDTLNTQLVTGDDSSETFQADSNLIDDNTESFAFTLQAAFPYSVFIEGGSVYNTGRSLSDIYAYLQYYLRDGQNIAERIIYTSDGSSITELAAEEYIKAQDSFNATKAAPFGTIAGGVFFSAQGVWVQGMASADNNNVRLLDNNAVLHTPELSITITITNTIATDRVAIYLDADSDTLPDKGMYKSAATGNDIDTSRIDHDDTTAGSLGVTAFPNDTPTGGTSGGTVIMVDNTYNQQHRYRYDSFANTGGTGDDGFLLLPTKIGPNASESGTTGQTLFDTTAFAPGGTSNVQIGDIIHRTIGGNLGYCYVTEVTSSSELQTTLFEQTGPSVPDRTWTEGDTYEIHSLVKTYDGDDTFFIPYMDEIATTTSISVDLTYVSNRTVTIEVRNVEAATEIVPFKTPGTITNTGLSQGVIRNEDTVFTP